MALPAELAQLLDQVEQHVAEDSIHSCSPFYRYQIYRRILNFSEGKEVLGWLDILTVQKVLAICKEVWPDDRMPIHILSVARNILEKTVDKELAEQETDRAWDYLEQRAEDDVDSSAFYAASAAVEALLRIIGRRGRWENKFITPQYSEADLDPWSSDVAHWAVSAYAGTVWQNDVEAPKQLQFWTWWLEEAVPTAWGIVFGTNET